MSENGTTTIEGLLLTIQRLEIKIDNLQKKIDSLQSNKHKSESQWLTLKELQDYIPSHPSESTVRRLISSYAFPSFRSGKFVIVRKSDVDEWLQHSKQMSAQETDMCSDIFVSNKKSLKQPPWRQKTNLNIPIKC